MNALKIETSEKSPRIYATHTLTDNKVLYFIMARKTSYISNEIGFSIIHDT